MSTMLRAALAVAAFSALHSLLATRGTKALAARVVGERRRDAGYRLFFVAQSVLATAALLAYTARLPRRTLYRVTGPFAALLRVGQVTGVLHLLSGLYAVGPLQWSGLRNLLAYADGGRPSPGPVAQGPEQNQEGNLVIAGPFHASRHPLNFAALPLFWLTPHMTTRRMGFNIASTLYFILGSWHEEARLRAAHGEVYLRYAQHVPFFWPRLQPSLSASRDTTLLSPPRS